MPVDPLSRQWDRLLKVPELASEAALCFEHGDNVRLPPGRHAEAVSALEAIRKIADDMLHLIDTPVGGDTLEQESATERRVSAPVRFTDAELRELARLYNTEMAQRILLRMAGFRMGAVPLGTPDSDTFWNEVNRVAVGEEVVGVLREAAHVFPQNQAFSRRA